MMSDPNEIRQTNSKEGQTYPATLGEVNTTFHFYPDQAIPMQYIMTALSELIRQGKLVKELLDVIHLLRQLERSLLILDTLVQNQDRRRAALDFAPLVNTWQVSVLPLIEKILLFASEEIELAGSRLKIIEGGANGPAWAIELLSLRHQIEASLMERKAKEFQALVSELVETSRRHIYLLEIDLERAIDRHNQLTDSLVGAFSPDEEVSGEVSSLQKPTSSSFLLLRILETPLSSYNLGTILSTFTELHTKCWLIQQGRFADLMDYTQTHQPRFAQESNLVITKLSYNSPAEIIAAVASFIVGGALVKGIDGILQTRLRYHRTKLELESKQQELERQKAEAVSADREHQLQLKEHEIAVQRRQLELDKELFLWEQQRLTIITETSTIMVEALRPEADPQTKAMSARTLVPQLLTLSQVQGLEITSRSEPMLPEEGTPPSLPPGSTS